VQAGADLMGVDFCIDSIENEFHFRYQLQHLIENDFHFL